MARRNLTKAELKRRRFFRQRIILVLGIAGALYLIIPLFLGDMGILKYFGMLKKHHHISAEIHELIEENRELQQKVEALRSDPDVIEKIAREQLGLVKEGELVYKFKTEEK
jgi:cell division protein FtsB